MPINDAKRFNERSASAASMARGALAGTIGILRVLRVSDAVTAEQAAVIANAMLDAMDGAHRPGVAKLIDDLLPEDIEPGHG